MEKIRPIRVTQGRLNIVKFNTNASFLRSSVSFRCTLENLPTYNSRKTEIFFGQVPNDPLWYKETVNFEEVGQSITILSALVTKWGIDANYTLKCTTQAALEPGRSKELYRKLGRHIRAHLTPDWPLEPYKKYYHGKFYL